MLALRPVVRLALPTLAALLAACSGDRRLVIVGRPVVAIEAGESYVYQPSLQSAQGTPTFTLTGPVGMTVSPLGRVEWTTVYEDLGSYNINLTVEDGSGAVATQTWVLRVHQGFELGVALSPRGHTGSTTASDFEDFYSNTEHGRLIAFHGAWRDSLATAGAIPVFARDAMDLARRFGFTPVIGFGWSDGDGAPDLTSESDRLTNAWTNLETRAEFLQMVRAFAGIHRPRYLFLGNETNSYFVTHDAGEWAAWISEFEVCYDAIKSVSPDTIVYTTFQLEKMHGLGANNGWSFPAHFELIDDHVASGKIDAIGFTSYPYFEYAEPADIPSDHYTRIRDHWDGPVAFSEIGWLSAPSGPYPGGEAQQSEFLATFFTRTRDLDLQSVVWLFLHDFDGDAGLPAFRGIGLRDNTGENPRPVDAFWRDAVVLRQN